MSSKKLKNAEADMPTHIGIRGLYDYLQGRSLPLMISLFLLLLFYPLFEDPANELPSWPARILFSIIPIIGVLSLHTRRWSLYFVLGLGAVVFVMEWLPFGMLEKRPNAVVWIESITAIVFFSFCTVLIIRSVFIRNDLKDHPVYGGITAYLLMGMTFAIIYSLINEFDDSAFHVHDALVREDMLPWGDLLYFSFATLTTLGYGDVTPLNSFARALSVLEAVAGVLYVAVLISQLILSPSLRDQLRK